MSDVELDELLAKFRSRANQFLQHRLSLREVTLLSIKQHFQCQNTGFVFGAGWKCIKPLEPTIDVASRELLGGKNDDRIEIAGLASNRLFGFTHCCLRIISLQESGGSKCMVIGSNLVFICSAI